MMVSSVICFTGAVKGRETHRYRPKELTYVGMRCSDSY